MARQNLTSSKSYCVDKQDLLNSKFYGVHSNTHSAILLPIFMTYAPFSYNLTFSFIRIDIYILGCLLRLNTSVLSPIAFPTELK